MTPLRVSGDVRLFVLGDEGVLFSESRQELYTLNTSATFIWCLLEDGVTLDALVEAYANTFSLSRPVAEQHVHPALRRWFGLGHIVDPSLPVPGVTPLTEALAWLLTNRELRHRFKVAPEVTSAALGVAGDEHDAFVALDSDSLDRLADDITDHRHQQRFGAAQGTIPLDASHALTAATRVPVGAETVRRCYRIVSTTFRVTMSPALDGLVWPVLAHLETDCTSAADVTIHVHESDGGCVVLEGMLPVAWHPSTAMLAPSLKLLLRRLAVARHSYFMEIHAGVVSFGTGVVLLPGSAGRGKTTLTAALVRDGGIYFSDEIALLEGPGLDVRPMPLAMTVKPGSVAPLRDLYPELITLDEHVREDRQPVRYLPPPPDRRCPADQSALPARWVVFPHYEAGGETALTPLSPAHGLRRLLDESLVLPDLLDRQKVEQLVNWTRHLLFFDLRLSSLDAGVRAVRDVVA